MKGRLPGHFVSEETKNKISNSLKSKKITQWNKGITKDMNEKIRLQAEAHSKRMLGRKWDKDKYKERNMKISTANRLKVNNKTHNFLNASRETREKISKTNIEKFKDKTKHPRWNGGSSVLSSQIRESNLYDFWKNFILCRDDYTCCYCNKRGGLLNVHHKVTFSKLLRKYKILTLEDAYKCNELWNFANGITLCRKCHEETFKHVEENI